MGRATRLLGGLMVAASLLPTHASAADSVKIGVLPLTDPVADTGNNSRQGMVWAAEQINASGDIKSLNGAKLELVEQILRGSSSSAYGIVSGITLE